MLMVTPWQAAFVGFSNWRGLPLEQALYPGAYRLEIDRDAPKERRGWEAMAWNAANLAVYEKFYDELTDTVRVQADRVLSLPALQRIESCWYRGKTRP